MTTKELLKQIASIIHQEFEHTNKFLKSLLKNQGEIKTYTVQIKTNMATKADIQELTKKISTYMEVIMIYKTKQLELEKQIDAILEYLGISNN